MPVKLLTVMGDDLTIVDAARVSFHKSAEAEYLWDQLKVDDPDLFYFLQRELTEEGRSGRLRAFSWRFWLRQFGYMRLKPEDAALLNFLARNRHASPFEHVVFTFYIKCALDERSEWHRHRIASYNEVSTRYSVMENDFVVPDREHITKQVGRPGAYTYEPIDNEEDAEWVAEQLNAVNQLGYETYQRILKRGFSRQVARKAFTVAKTTEFYFTVNLRSLFNFMYLRNSTGAFDYIRDDAAEIERLVRLKVPAAMAAWDKGDRLPI